MDHKSSQSGVVDRLIAQTAGRQDGVISLDKPTSETSVDELNEIVVEQYRRARQAQLAASGNGQTSAG